MRGFGGDDRLRGGSRNTFDENGEDVLRGGRGHEARAAGLAAERVRATDAAKTAEQRRAEAFVLDKLAALGRIRLALLQDVWRDKGGDPWTIPATVEALGCRVEVLPEHGNRTFVFPPTEAVA